MVDDFFLLLDQANCEKHTRRAIRMRTTKPAAIKFMITPRDRP